VLSLSPALLIALSLSLSHPRTRNQTVQWFVDPPNQRQSGLTVCRIKNKFLLTDDEAKDGYRDVSLNVLFEAENGLRIIGEIQVCLCVRACA
jgi:hypothetical protein